MTFNDQDRTLPVAIEDNGIHTSERVGTVRVAFTFAAMFAFVAIFLYGVNNQRAEVAQGDQPAAQNEPKAQQKQQQAGQQQGQQPATTGQGGDQGGREPRQAEQPQAAPQKNPPKQDQPSTPNRNDPQPPRGNTQQ